MAQTVQQGCCITTSVWRVCVERRWTIFSWRQAQFEFETADECRLHCIQWMSEQWSIERPFHNRMFSKELSSSDQSLWLTQQPKHEQAFVFFIYRPRGYPLSAYSHIPYVHTSSFLTHCPPQSLPLDSLRQLHASKTRLPPDLVALNSPALTHLKLTLSSTTANATTTTSVPAAAAPGVQAGAVDPAAVGRLGSGSSSGCLAALSQLLGAGNTCLSALTLKGEQTGILLMV